MVDEPAPPAPRPCDSCPYRRDTPSGVWSFGEYEKLRAYDADIHLQPHRVFLCHQAAGTRKRVCAGWASCHNRGELLALRLAAG